ncbi:lamin tail domain-containing protein [candidate division WWE3 bacterium]|uniref:Lamin tail domain-containing protein n=1 Tax=candidate division WWE3 bacterium TaxID=2053526 RepID=A0A955LWC4_UNCKA|nr:lamin tail domain-containing protein [candidate division WWE3 bacterium]
MKHYMIPASNRVFYLLAILFSTSFFYISKVYADELTTEFPSSVFISEFMPAPIEGDEWVEICNPTVEEVDIGGWFIDDAPDGSKPFTIPDETVLLPEVCLEFYMSNKFNNDGDEIRLLNSSQEIIDGYQYISSNPGDSYIRVSMLDWEESNDPNPGVFPNSPKEAGKTDSTVNTIEITFSPKKILSNEVFEIKGEMYQLKPNTEYSLKIMAGFDVSKLIDSKTVKNDASYSWNSSWDNFPTVKTDSLGNAKFQLNGLVEKEHEAKSIYVSVRARAASTSKNIDSDLEKISFENQKSTTKPTNTTKKKEREELLIDDIKDILDGEIVLVTGTVTSDFDELGSKTFYIQDESGGVKIVSRKSGLDTIIKGKIVTVVGITSTAFNEKYIKVIEPDDIEIIGQGDLPDILPQPTGNIGEEQEGRLVQVVGQVASTSGNTFYLDDGTGPAKVYIKDSTGIDKPYMRTGYYSAITGIVSQYIDDYRILPRTQEDVIVSKTPISTVLGQAILQLPATGYGFGQKWSFGSTVLIVGIVFRIIAHIFNRMVIQHA